MEDKFHADLTVAYREYLELAKIKPNMLNPSMLGLIEQFLRYNEITAEGVLPRSQGPEDPFHV